LFPFFNLAQQKKKVTVLKKKMHSVCKQLYVHNTPVNVFMNQVDPDLVLSLCNAALPPSNLLLFNADNESPKFLKDWLVYRGVQPSDDEQLLAQQASDDMQAKRNSPAITGFVNFDVRDASDDFLRIWMSWFGLGSKHERSRRWWEKHAQQTQDLRKSVKDERVGHLRMQWTALVDMQKKIDQMVNFVVCSGATLAQESWVPQVAADYKPLKTSKEEEAVFAKYAEEPVKKKRKMKRRWMNHERKMEAMTYASQIDMKKIMAGLMNVGFVALPIFYDPQENELNLKKPKQLKDDLGRYYTELKTMKDPNKTKNQNGTLNDATLSQKKDKVLSDLRSKLDPTLSQELLKIGLEAGGVPNANALSQLAQQVIASGAVTDASVISRSVDKSTETLAAKLVLNAMLGQKEPEKDTHDKEAVKKLLAALQIDNSQ
jgi:hypothetical protein